MYCYLFIFFFASNTVERRSQTGGECYFKLINSQMKWKFKNREKKSIFFRFVFGMYPDINFFMCSGNSRSVFVHIESSLFTIVLKKHCLLKIFKTVMRLKYWRFIWSFICLKTFLLLLLCFSFVFFRFHISQMLFEKFCWLFFNFFLFWKF